MEYPKRFKTQKTKENWAFNEYKQFYWKIDKVLQAKTYEQFDKARKKFALWREKHDIFMRFVETDKQLLGLYKLYFEAIVLIDNKFTGR